MVRHFHSRTGGQVLWIDPYPTRLPILSDVLDKRPLAAAVDDVPLPGWLNVIKPNALPIEPLPYSGRLNRLLWSEVFSCVDKFADGSTLLGVGKPSELALQLLAKKQFASTFYDAMDDFPAFYSGWSSYAMASRERKIVSWVSTVFASSSALKERLIHHASDVRLVLNACATGRLIAVDSVRPQNKDRTPVIGYVGTIAQWFDWDLVFALADANPHARFHLIGPVYGRPPASIPANVKLVPPLPHAEALLAMAQFDVGLIPFKRTPLTSSVDPIKYYEYRALGLPVVSSSFGQMALRAAFNGVYLIDSNSDLDKVLNQAFTDSPTAKEIAQFRKENSWESRFDQANIFSL